ncbi:uncharacterized protein LOC119671060 [Teleopsis dalmanni]|uniref:uncharacterized protein LOC119671060 n=1 Tax=Teleopsis dalmanni TaxID=139649 RepID=UPI000D32AB72|nr:uncharacterized protein LOC119671060 [Teleopsis dalmanni]
MKRDGFSRMGAFAAIEQELEKVNQECSGTPQKNDANLPGSAFSSQWNKTYSPPENGYNPAFCRGGSFNGFTPNPKWKNFKLRKGFKLPKENKESDENESDHSEYNVASDQQYTSRVEPPCNHFSYSSDMTSASEMGQRDFSMGVHFNIVMLLGLITGLFVSKFLQYLEMYFRWFQVQIEQLRLAVLGRQTIWQLCNFDDESNYSARTKIVMLPIALLFGLVYGFFFIMHWVIRFMRTQAPSGLVKFINKLQRDA